MVESILRAFRINCGGPRIPSGAKQTAEKRCGVQGTGFSPYMMKQKLIGFGR
jgi:hypothetical protein